MSSKLMSAAEAAQLLNDDATIAVGASSGVSLPEATLAAIGSRFERTGSPRGVTAIFPINVGDMFGQPGLNHLAHPGLLTRLIGGSYPSGPSQDQPPPIRQRIAEGAVEAFNYPIGHILRMLSESAAKGVGFLTRTGLGAFIDPRNGGGGLNDLSRAAPFVRLVEIDGAPAIFYPPVRVDLSIVRATSADEDGNLTFEHEAAVIAPFTLAAAAKTSGGRVIAQVKRIIPREKMDRRAVKVPGYMVDAIVVVPDQSQATLTQYDSSLSGQSRIDPRSLPPIEDPLEAFLMRRAAREIREGDIAVLGFGVCAGIPRLLGHAGESDKATFLIEQGAVGGLPVDGFRFGCSQNSAAYLDVSLGFEYLRGGGFDLAMLSFLQIDGRGNVNVSSLPSRPHVTAGIGGFMDIIYNAPRVLFAGRLRGGASSMHVEPDRLVVESEGPHAKIVNAVDEITVPGDVLRRPGREVRIVTERCTFELTCDGLHLVEIVPGFRPEQIAALCTAPFTIADELQVMPRSLFSEQVAPLITPKGASHAGERL